MTYSRIVEIEEIQGTPYGPVAPKKFEAPRFGVPSFQAKIAPAKKRRNSENHEEDGESHKICHACKRTKITQARDMKRKRGKGDDESDSDDGDVDGFARVVMKSKRVRFTGLGDLWQALETQSFDSLANKILSVPRAVETKGPFTTAGAHLDGFGTLEESNDPPSPNSSGGHRASKDAITEPDSSLFVYNLSVYCSTLIPPSLEPAACTLEGSKQPPQLQLTPGSYKVSNPFDPIYYSTKTTKLFTLLVFDAGRIAEVLGWFRKPAMSRFTDRIIVQRDHILKLIKGIITIEQSQPFTITSADVQVITEVWELGIRLAEEHVILFHAYADAYRTNNVAIGTTNCIDEAEKVLDSMYSSHEEKAKQWEQDVVLWHQEFRRIETQLNKSGRVSEVTAAGDAGKAREE
jgi:hypothetical protein